MKSVGESMGIGRTFAEAFVQGAPRARDRRRAGSPRASIRGSRASSSARRAEDGSDATPVYRRVDSCAGEVEAASNYFYSTAASATSAPPEPGRSVVILGSGPNRIGQGIEFDYCCVHAAQSFRAQGYEAVMVNCNPETVSTDYDTSDRLYFEPLDEEAVLAVLAREQPVGVCIQFGGQTPLKLARAIERGRASGSSARRSTRSTWPRTASASAGSPPSSASAARSGGSPPTPTRRSRSPRGSATRCSSGPRTCSAAARCASATTRRQCARRWRRSRAPSLVDRFLENAIELDVDALCDGADTYVAAVMEHVEEAGIHSGDSSCVLPAPSRLASARSASSSGGSGRRSASSGCSTSSSRSRAARSTCSRSNPRASRTVPFASKATGVNLVDAACRLAAGATLAELDLPPEGAACAGYHVKAAVLPFVRFAGADPVLGPEMRSTGEVMASGADFADRVREGRARRRPGAAAAGAGVPDRPRRRQGRASSRSRGARRARLRARRDRPAPRAALELAEIAVDAIDEGRGRSSSSSAAGGSTSS